MRASKESCREALKAVNEIEQACEGVKLNKEGAEVLLKFNQVREFLACAEKRLPSEAALDKDKTRRRKK